MKPFLGLQSPLESKKGNCQITHYNTLTWKESAFYASPFYT